MADILTPQERSALMSRIRGVNTQPELVIRRALHAMGYRFRLHARDLPGRPDIVLPSKRTVIFVHGCFWHRHDCGLAYTPKTRSEFWQKKFAGNVERDRRAKDALEAAGWHVIVIWECQLDKPSVLAARLAKRLGPAGRIGGTGVVMHQGTRERIRVRAKALRPPRRGAHSP
jgi:DNA mismatch endonuclease (patch repair protein)